MAFEAMNVGSIPTPPAKIFKLQGVAPHTIPTTQGVNCKEGNLLPKLPKLSGF